MGGTRTDRPGDAGEAGKTVETYVYMQRVMNATLCSQVDYRVWLYSHRSVVQQPQKCSQLDYDSRMGIGDACPHIDASGYVDTCGTIAAVAGHELSRTHL